MPMALMFLHNKKTNQTMQPKRDEKMDDFFSNMHKEAYGFKPNATVFAKWTALTEEGKQSWQDERSDELQPERQARTYRQWAIRQEGYRTCQPRCSAGCGRLPS